MKILVSGISGFIGSHLAAALSVLGHEVTGTYRSNPPRDIRRYAEGFPPVNGRSAVTAGSVTGVRADLSEYQTVEDLIRGKDAVIHVAGLVGDWGTKERFHRANILPVEHIIRGIRTIRKQDSSQAPGYFIHTSSISVHGFGDLVNAGEEGPYFKLITHYQRSKLESEEIVQEFSRTEPTVCGIIRPGNVYGPEDTTTMYPMLDAIRDGKMGFVDGGKRLTCPVFIDDMVSAYISLLDKMEEDPEPVNGEVFNITGGEQISWKEQIGLCAEKSGLPRPRLNAPGWLVLPVSGILAGLYALAGSKNPPDLTPYRIQQVRNNYHFSMEKARHLLGWEPRTPFAQGIVPTVRAWKEENGDGSEREGRGLGS
ncbi:NAD-dependent epimerase/dehydratase family protein [Salinispira pacifica]|uniref:Dihydroflavonol-4-reductase n=1 Tax=Salinispira pacifica TaxID=1307761 RepID=V5WMM6_9SPIO|nr:NAD-dependent epimerase/dehydratase family protein [Salinispira pacifica]AHC16421.1 Dihydroflavonol-4-reductase [Salinispira pacifica]